jgi:hypothetical protein
MYNKGFLNLIEGVGRGEGEMKSIGKRINAFVLVRFYKTVDEIGDIDIGF